MLIDPLERAWVQCRTVGAFRMAEALISHRNRGADYLTEEVVRDAVVAIMDAPMPEGFTLAEAEYLLN